MMSDKVSVAIPTYNRVDLLKRAVDSVKSQDYSNTEIIISDNCSDDSTCEYLDSIKECSNITINRNDRNIGMVANWDKCLDLSTGEFFILMSDDDYFLEADAISRLVSKFAFDDVAFVFSEVLIHNVDTGIKQSTKLKQSRFNLADLTYDFFSNKVQIYPCSTMLRADDIRRVGGYSSFNVKYSCDACAWINSMFRGGLAVGLPSPLTVYTVHNSLSSASVLEWKSEFLGIKKFIDNNKHTILKEDYDRIVSGLNIGRDRIPIGYILRSFRHKKNYNILDVLKDVFTWRKYVFTKDNILFLARRFILRK